jgi:hypothetical protein
MRCGEFFWLAEDISASQEGLCSVELVNAGAYKFSKNLGVTSKFKVPKAISILIKHKYWMPP